MLVNLDPGKIYPTTSLRAMVMIYFHEIWIKTMFCVDLDGFMLVYVLMWWMLMLYEIFPWNIFFQFLKIFYLDSLWKIEQFSFLRNSIPIKIEKNMNFGRLEIMVATCSLSWEFPTNSEFLRFFPQKSNFFMGLFPKIYVSNFKYFYFGMFPILNISYYGQI